MAAAIEDRSGRLDERYQLINWLGAGGMASVHRALDRLTGRVVSVKRLQGVASFTAATPNGQRTERVGLTQEFRLLSSMRHPNIISVLDYGFDRRGAPFLVMDLQENAATIVEAARGRPLSVVADLFFQLLRGLDYLHRHGVIHRDLKPENVVVVNDSVKVLDLGISIFSASRHLLPDLAGTPLYMAPELLERGAPSYASDLWAAGLVGFEMFAGSYPFDRSSVAAFHRSLRETELPRPTDPIDPRLAPILRRLLARSADARYRSAAEAITDLAAVLGVPMAAETATTRESFLQSAPFIGRQSQLETLHAAAREAAAGRGAAWLVSGESGVGKSRLIDELRVLALVDGIRVVQGQARSTGGAPYHAWSDVVARLVLGAGLGDGEAAALKAVVPRLADILDRSVPDPLPLDPDASQARVALAVEKLVGAQDRPVLVLIEDMQWLGTESLHLWTWLARAASSYPLCLVGTYRSDEAANLRNLVEDSRTLDLGRLVPDEIRSLASSMLGDRLIGPALSDFLERETEGNPFFVVEVMRALAEQAGTLQGVARGSLPPSILSGGMTQVIQRRLGQVSPEAREALRSAAVVGREIESQLLLDLHRGLDFEAWTEECAAAAVLELRDQQWRFPHDKLREQLLRDMPPEERARRHRDVATKLERLDADEVIALAHHWREGGDLGRELEFAERAGFLSLERGACLEAVGYLERCLELLSAEAAPSGLRRSRRPRLDLNAAIDPACAGFRVAAIEGAMGDAWFRMGDLRAATEHLRRSLHHVGVKMPATDLGWSVALVREAILRALQRLLRTRTCEPSRDQRVVAVVGQALGLVCETSFYSMRTLPLTWSLIRLVNQCEPVGPSHHLAHAYMELGLLASLVPLPRVSGRWMGRALETAEGARSDHYAAWILSRMTVIAIQDCRWAAAERAVAEAVSIAERAGDVRKLEECLTTSISVEIYQARFDGVLSICARLEELARRSGNRQVGGWVVLARADALLHKGRIGEALALYDSALQSIDQDAQRTDAIWCLGMRALALLRSGDREAALQSANRALEHIMAITPIIYFLDQSIAGTTEVFLDLAGGPESESLASRSVLLEQARKSSVAMRRFAARLPLGRILVHTWRGSLDYLEGRRRSADRRWREALRVATELDKPYDLGQALLEFGRRDTATVEERRRHLTRAIEIFGALGAELDLERTRQELRRIA